MDPMDILSVGAEVGGIVDLVLEKYTGDFIANEVGWL